MPSSSLPLGAEFRLSSRVSFLSTTTSANSLLSLRALSPEHRQTALLRDEAPRATDVAGAERRKTFSPRIERRCEDGTGSIVGRARQLRSIATRAGGAMYGAEAAAAKLDRVGLGPSVGRCGVADIPSSDLARQASTCCAYGLWPMADVVARG
eukprot:5601918-Prymnesium_polylepis.2